MILSNAGRICRKTNVLCCLKNYENSNLLSSNCAGIQILRNSFDINGFLSLGGHRCKPFDSRVKNYPYKTYSTSSKQESILEVEKFNSYFQTICDDLSDVKNPALEDAVTWLAKVFQYNVSGGKKNRGLTVVRSFKILARNGASDLELRHANILGWCVEMLQTYLLVCDDIMDQAIMRRGEICWYRKPDVGLCAVNDALMLQCGIYRILLKYFEKYDFYAKILHEFLMVTEKTVYGQCLDMLCCPASHKPRFENFTFEKYRGIVEHKTSHYTFCLPVRLAMHLNGESAVEDFIAAEIFCIKLGLLFQIQDDFLDCYGNPEKTGKVGNDICQGKCSWFAVSVFEFGSHTLKKEMAENYGSSNPESMLKVLKIYDELNLKEQFKAYESKLYVEILESLDRITSKNLQDLFFNLLQNTYRREK